MTGTAGDRMQYADGSHLLQVENEKSIVTVLQTLHTFYIHNS